MSIWPPIRWFLWLVAGILGVGTLLAIQAGWPIDLGTWVSFGVVGGLVLLLLFTD